MGPGRAEAAGGRRARPAPRAALSRGQLCTESLQPRGLPRQTLRQRERNSKGPNPDLSGNFKGPEGATHRLTSYLCTTVILTGSSNRHEEQRDRGHMRWRRGHPRRVLTKLREAKTSTWGPQTLSAGPRIWSSWLFPQPE